MTMIVVNIFEAKAKLSEYLDMAAHGERVLICKRNRPVVELHAVESARTTPRPVGLARGRMTVPPSFFEPLPEDVSADSKGPFRLQPRRCAVRPIVDPASSTWLRVRPPAAPAGSAANEVPARYLRVSLDCRGRA